MDFDLAQGTAAHIKGMRQVGPAGAAAACRAACVDRGLGLGAHLSLKASMTVIIARPPKPAHASPFLPLTITAGCPGHLTETPPPWPPDRLSISPSPSLPPPPCPRPLPPFTLLWLQWITSEYLHCGIREAGATIFEKLLNMARGGVLLR